MLGSEMNWSDEGWTDGKEDLVTDGDDADILD